MKKLMKEETVKMENEAYDFGGYATRNDLLCGDGRTIRKNAFKDNDGTTVPLIWNHDHSNPEAVLGHALLENRNDGVYAYCTFNDTEAGQNAKKLVHNGDVRSLSIYANQLKQIGKDVVHGAIRELSLVLAGANPGAFIDWVMAHGEDEGECAIVNYDENALTIYHSAQTEATPELQHSEEKKEDPKMAEDAEKKPESTDEGSETIGDILKTLNEKQMTAVQAVVGQILSEKDEKDDSEGGTETMKHNLFDQDEQTQGGFLSHSDEEAIISLAKNNSCGSLRTAMEIYAENNSLAHGIDDLESLFPEYKDVRPGAPELIERDQGWISTVMQKVHKSPISRIRTRQADARQADLRAFGYQKKGDQKLPTGNVKLLKRTTDPQTIYIKDSLHRDDIIDMVDFDVVNYTYGIMRNVLNEEVATAIMISDGRDDGDENKIHEEHIRSIWHDDDLYTIHADVDIAGAKSKLQGTNTSANFGDNYVYAEAIIEAALYSREKYKGSGNLDFYCTPHLLNVMLLARDMNGRRIYDSKADLAAALNVGAIYTVEQFEGRTRTTKDNKTKKLLGLFVNLSDYQVGSTKGGEITRFNQFDIDFNQEKYLIETRLSGALTRIYSAIALEEDVTVGG